MTTHRFHPTRYFNVIGTAEPCLRIADGDTVVTDTIDADVKSANRLKFTLDGKLALVSVPRSNDLTVIDVATHKVTKRIAVGRGGSGILMQPDGKRAYVACNADNYIAVIDLATLTVSGKIESGGAPDGMAWAVRR